MRRTPKIQNTYFEELYKKAEAHSQLVEAHEALKPDLFRNNATDAERARWYQKLGELREANPVLGGVGKAFRAWYWGNTDELELDDHLWDHEVHDFVETLRAAGIETFVYTNRSTAVMDNLHDLVAEGCTMLGLCTLTKNELRFGSTQEEQVRGIRFRVN